MQLQPFSNPQREHRRRLDLFRQYFRQTTADGEYPPERQQQLYAWCQQAGLNWDEARQYVREDARQLLRRQIRAMLDVAPLSSADQQDIQRFQRRLGLSESDIQQAITEAKRGKRLKVTKTAIGQAKTGVYAARLGCQLVALISGLVVMLLMGCMALYYFGIAAQGFSQMAR